MSEALTACVEGKKVCPEKWFEARVYLEYVKSHDKFRWVYLDEPEFNRYKNFELVKALNEANWLETDTSIKPCLDLFELIAWIESDLDLTTPHGTQKYELGILHFLKKEIERQNERA